MDIHTANMLLFH